MGRGRVKERLSTCAILYGQTHRQPLFKHDAWPHPNFEKILQPIDAVLLYKIPLSFISVVYFKIIVKLSSINSKQLPPARRRFVAQRRRAIRKIIHMIVIFALCHLPIHVFHILRVSFLEYWAILATDHPWLFSVSVNLVLVTYVLNPLVYVSLYRCFMCCAAFFKYISCCYVFNTANGLSRFTLVRRSNTQQTNLKIRAGSPQKKGLTFSLFSLFHFERNADKRFTNSLEPRSVQNFAIFSFLLI